MVVSSSSKYHMYIMLHKVSYVWYDAYGKVISNITKKYVQYIQYISYFPRGIKKLEWSFFDPYAKVPRLNLEQPVCATHILTTKPDFYQIQAFFQ